MPVVQPGVPNFCSCTQKTKLKVFLLWAEMKDQFPWAQQFRELPLLKESMGIWGFDS